MYDALIIGAGLAGSSLAAALASHGWDVLLVERDHFPRHKVCGEFLSPEVQRSLQALGLHADVAALAPAPVQHARLVTQTGRVVELPLPGCAWGLSRYAMDRALATAAEQRGATLWTGATVKDYQCTDNGYVVQVRKSEEMINVPTRALIAACGRHSQAALPPKERPLARDQQFVGVKCHYAGVIMPAQVELFLFPGGYAGINPVEQDRVNVCLLASYPAFAQAGKRVDKMLTAAAYANPALGQRLAEGQARSETAASVAPVDVYRPAAPWTGIACIGDAAVMIPPFCGDGMAMALRSAELCAPLAHAFLQGTLSLDGWAATYQKIWHAEFDQRLRIARLLQRALNIPWLSNLGVDIGRLMPSLGAYLVQATRG
ncbi:MAG: NAD(P)/FAD-dependent oxidoreductase [Caldilineaceae bacterium]